ncbi:MAG TPA: hypothetical protein DCF84_08905 [Bacteroidetes bacterium]|nr:hypothetical protein [Bacteroidota bacterium]|tara:strand:- start:235 stop:1794 length:1560 start_codon:yes stop_codon:yes gene_type:complete
MMIPLYRMILKQILVVLFIGLTSASSYSQGADPDLASPQKAIETHLLYLQDGSYNPERSAKAIPASVGNLKERKTVAIKLKELFDGMGLYLNPEFIPQDPDYVDTNYNNQNIYSLTPLNASLYLIRDTSGNWVYSEATIQGMDKAYKEIYPFGVDFLKNLLPYNIGMQSFLGLTLWQWLGIGILVIGAFLLRFLLTQLLSFVVGIIFRSALKQYAPERGKLIEMLRYLSIFLVIKGLDIASSSLQLNPYLYNYITIGFLISGCVALVFGFLKAIDILHEYLTKIVERTENQMDDQLLPVVVRIMNILVIGAGVVYALTVFNVDLTAILAGLSVGALALALAAQDTVKNFLGSVTVFVDKPFKIGDYVKVNGVEATVESVGIRSTRLRTPDRSLVTIPNGELSNMTIDNLGERNLRRWKTVLGLTYDSKPEAIQSLCKSIKELYAHSEHIDIKNSSVHLHTLNASSIDVLLLIYMDANSYGDELDIREQLIFEIMGLVAKEGLSFAFPSQSIYIESQPKQ